MLTTDQKIEIWVFVGVLAILTVLFNLYILLVNLKKYRKEHHLNPGDTILTVIALCSICLQVLSYFWMTLDKMDPECVFDLLESVLLVAVMIFKYCILWSTAFLTFYYGTKLVITPIDCYTKIQEVILKHVLTGLALIILGGIANGIPLYNVMSHNLTITDQADCGSFVPKDESGKIYIFYYMVVSDIIPGMIMIKSSVSISIHLAIHLRHMKASTNGAHGPKLGPQMRVIKMTLTLVVVYLCFLAVDLYTHITVVLWQENTITFALLFLTVYTTVSAIILVYGKKSIWTQLVQWYNLFLDAYPCMHCLKVSENKNDPKHGTQAAKA